MRIVELSNHPGEMLQHIHLQRRTESQRAQSQYEAALAQHRKDVDDLRVRRDRARIQRRWWLWLRCSLAIWGQGARAPRPPLLATGPTDDEDILTAGMNGEQAVADELGYVLDDDWTLLRGYRNRRGRSTMYCLARMECSRSRLNTGMQRCMSMVTAGNLRSTAQRAGRRARTIPAQPRPVGHGRSDCHAYSSQVRARRYQEPDGECCRHLNRLRYQLSR